MVLIGLLLIGVLGYYNYQRRAHFTPPKITENQLVRMLQAGEVARVSLLKEKGYVAIKLKEKALQKALHRQQVKDADSEIHYSLPIVSNSIFDKHWQQIQKGLKPAFRMDYVIVESSGFYKDLQGWGSWLFLLFFLFMIFGSGFRRNSIFGLGKSRAKLWESEGAEKTTFKDVAGLKEAKAEVMEIVDFLKHPERFEKIGARLPKGVLFVGSPGTGKTLLARAIAEEAGVRFLYMSGSDFSGMIVGVGVARVRDLFTEARKKTPCILFIDEIESIGRRRGQNPIVSGGSEDRESTLNTLLTELDGIKKDTKTPIILIGATNQPEVLDPALLRPGRLDRKVLFERPTLQEREEIFKKHLAPLTTSRTINAKKLAAQTAGLVGSDIANICNESGIHAVVEGRKQVNDADLQVAIDRQTTGREKKSKVLDQEGKELVAWHESGHALYAWFSPKASKLVKLTIIPRSSGSLGHAQYEYPERYITTEAQLKAEIEVCLAGRGAETVRYKHLSTGAQNDLEKATQIAYQMVTTYGMSKKVSHVSYHSPRRAQEQAFVKPYAEKTAEMIDQEVRHIVDGAYKKVIQLLEAKKDLLKKLVQVLLKKETLNFAEVKAILGPRAELVGK